MELKTLLNDLFISYLNLFLFNLIKEHPLKHSHKKRKDSLETRAGVSWILILS